MKIVQKKISELRIASYNPRQMNKAQEEALTASLKKFGFAQPIVINAHPKRKNIIVGGHQRVIVAKKLGIKLIPCVPVNLPIEQERELNIRLNKNGGEWDMKMLQIGFDITELLSWGFEKKELDFDVAELVDNTTKKKKPRANVEVQFQLGELRFVLPQEAYVKWIDALAKVVGMKKQKQVDEIKKRLKIETEKKK